MKLFQRFESDAAKPNLSSSRFWMTVQAPLQSSHGVKSLISMSASQQTREQSALTPGAPQ